MTEEAIWFVEELVPGETSGDAPRKGDSDSIAAEWDERVELRANQPRWRVLPESEKADLFVEPHSQVVLVRVGFQFAIPLRLHEKGHKVVWARCSVGIEGSDSPRVIDLYPRDLYDGSVREIKVDLSPKLTLGTVEASLGGVQGAVEVGRVQAVIVGYPGADERAPYWEITPKAQDLIGTRDFWLLLEAPKGCTGFELTLTVETDIQHRLARIPLGPREKKSGSRPRFRVRLPREA